jgi:hypothetical protein
MLISDLRRDGIDYNSDYDKTTRNWSENQIRWFAMAYNEAKMWMGADPIDPYAETFSGVYRYVAPAFSD